jgi:uncharacterized protein (UPF0261 family)
MATVLVLGTLDTKGPEYEFLCDRLRSDGLTPLVVDVGVLGEPAFSADVAREEVARAAGEGLQALVLRGDRGGAVSAMARGAEVIVRTLLEEGAISGAIALGGTGGTAIASRAFRVLPVGMPKVIVSTAASGNTQMYVGESDLVLMPSVTDIAGINRLSARIIANGAAALAGMVVSKPPNVDASKRVVGASMFGVTTPCVTAARAWLEERSYEVLVFHMTGTGGRTLEALASQGWLSGVLDVTTTELADELVGGVFSAGPGRMVAGRAVGLPQVVSVGALDMVNFGPPDTVPEKFKGRLFYEHNPSVTLMRTTPEESAELGRRLAMRLSAGRGRCAVFLPLRGVSALSVTGGPFESRAADEALFGAIREYLDREQVDLVECDTDINDPVFATAMAGELDRYICDESDCLTMGRTE